MFYTTILVLLLILKIRKCPENLTNYIHSILYTSKMFQLVENRIFAYADDSTLLTVVYKPSDRPDVSASSLNWDFARI